MSRSRKFAVLGSRSVGKSSLTVQYVESHFVESYYPTIENQFSKLINFNNKEYAIEIIDTAGQDEFSILNQKLLIGVHAYVLVYSISSRTSFEMLGPIRDKILDALGTSSIPMIVVGNKTDLASQRQVSHEEASSLARSFKCPCVEVSAKTNDGIDRAFELLLQQTEMTTEESAEKCVVM